MNVSVRPFEPGEGYDLLQIYFDAVRQGTHRHYSPEQAAAWAPDLPARDSAAAHNWEQRLRDTIFFVAVSGPDAQKIGFISVTHKGHIDLAFVRPEWMGRYVAAHLYERVLEWAAGTGLTDLSTDASHLFRAFLLRRGWQGHQAETLVRHGVELSRWPMHIDLKDQTHEQIL